MFAKRVLTRETDFSLYTGRCRRHDIQSRDDAVHRVGIVFSGQTHRIPAGVHRRLHEHDLLVAHRTVFRTTVRAVQNELYQRNSRRPVRARHLVVSGGRRIYLRAVRTVYIYI